MTAYVVHFVAWMLALGLYELREFDPLVTGEVSWFVNPLHELRSIAAAFVVCAIRNWSDLAVILSIIGVEILALFLALILMPLINVGERWPGAYLRSLKLVLWCTTCAPAPLLDLAATRSDRALDERQHVGSPARPAVDSVAAVRLRPPGRSLRRSARRSALAADRSPLRLMRLRTDGHRTDESLPRVRPPGRRIASRSASFDGIRGHTPFRRASRQFVDNNVGRRLRQVLRREPARAQRR